MFEGILIFIPSPCKSLDSLSISILGIDKYLDFYRFGRSCLLDLDRFEFDSFERSYSTLSWILWKINASALFISKFLKFYFVSVKAVRIPAIKP